MVLVCDMQHDKTGHIVHEFDVFMMATIAYHGDEDLSRRSPSLCRVYAEDNDFFYGQWVEISQLFDVGFPKETTRPLKNDERAYFSATRPEMLILSTGKDVTFEPIPNLTMH